MPTKPCNRLCATMICGTAALVLMLTPLGTSAEDRPVPPPAIMPANPEPPVIVGSGMSVTLGHSVISSPKKPVKRIAIADPKIADVQVLSPTQIMIVGKAVGSTDIVLWGDDDQAWQTRVQVDIDAAQLKDQLGKLFPGSKLDVMQRQDVLAITGQLRRSDHVKQLSDFMNSTGMKYVNMTSLAGVQQVMIHVRVAEASRDAIRALGINVAQGGTSAFGGSTIGNNPNGITIGPPPVGGTLSSATTLFGGVPSAQLQVFMEALAENQYLRILAEPTLVAISGEEASFLAGGEFPIPIAQGASGGGNTGGTSITIEYKEFGVRLRFRPTVQGDGTIRLVVAPEVSNLSDIGAVTIQGFRIPALQTRKAETTLEMKGGQTFAMAGLIDKRTTAISSRVPGLGDIPVLGSLFRSVRYEQGDTEMVVVATVELVEPLSITSPRPLPGDVHSVPTDWEVYAEGRIEGKQAPKISPTESRGMRDLGLDRLKGPGAWATYEQPASDSVPAPAPAPKD